MTKLGKKMIAAVEEGVEIARGTSDPCPACGLNRAMVGRAHNCRPRAQVTTNTKGDIKSVDSKPIICHPEPIVVTQVDKYTSDRVFDGKRPLSPERAEKIKSGLNSGRPKSDGVALTSVPYPISPMTGLFSTLTPEQQKSALEYRGEESFGDPAYRLNPASIVTVELSEDQVKNTSPDGLRLATKRGRGRPKIVGPRPWEIEGVSRKTWYKRQSKIKLGLKEQ